MRKIITGLVVALGLVAVVDVAEARGVRGGSLNKSVMGFKNYHLKHGTKFSNGYFYSGKKHFQWTHRCYYPKYRSYCYYCPSACSWYYWCEPKACFYPVSYIEKARPVVNTTVINLNTSAVANGNTITGNPPAVLPGMSNPVPANSPLGKE